MSQPASPPSCGGVALNSSPLFPTCLGRQRPTWSFPSTPAESGGFSPWETMERDSRRVSASGDLGPEPPSTGKAGTGLAARCGMGTRVRLGFQRKLKVTFLGATCQLLGQPALSQFLEGAAWEEKLMGSGDWSGSTSGLCGWILGSHSVVPENPSQCVCSWEVFAGLRITKNY